MSMLPDPALSTPARRDTTALLVAYLAVLLASLVAALYALVATDSAPAGARPAGLVLSHGSLLLAVVLAGALGSYVHTAASFALSRGGRRIDGSGSAGYVLSPFVGAAVAVVSYLAARGILLILSTGEPTLDPYGTMALAALAGMVSRPVADRVARRFGTPPAPGADLSGEGAWRPLGLAAFAPGLGGAAGPDSEVGDPSSLTWMGEKLFSSEKDEDEDPVSPGGEG